MDPQLLGSGSADDVVAPTGRAEGSRSEHERVVDLLLGAVALFVLVPYVPTLPAAVVTLPMVVVWSLGGAGLVALVVQARSDRTARWGLGFLAWSLVAALSSAQPALATFVAYAGDRGWVYLAGCLGCWAVGRRRSADTARFVVGGVVAGLLANAGLAVVQATSDGSGLAGLVATRAPGFLGNPVFLGALAAGTAVLAVSSAVRSSGRWWGWLPIVAVAAATINLSGSRVALGAAVLLGAVAARRAGWRTVLALATAGAIGLAASQGLIGATATSRTEASSSDGSEARTTAWRLGLEATAERPLVGWGPGRFRQATSPRNSAALTRTEGSDLVFDDAHDLPVELLTTTGLPGLVLAGGFAWGAARRARGPLAWCAATIGVTWLLQPTAAPIAIVALLALGVAGAGTGPAPPLAQPVARVGSRTAAVLLTLLGLVVGGRAVLADHWVGEGRRTDDAELVGHAADLFPRDPELADYASFRWFRRALQTKDPADEAAALAAARHAVEIDATRPVSWIRLGAVLQAIGTGSRADDVAAARRAYEEALRWDPWSGSALSSLYDLEVSLGNEAEADALARRLCEIDLCPAG